MEGESLMNIKALIEWLKVEYLSRKNIDEMHTGIRTNEDYIRIGEMNMAKGILLKLGYYVDIDLRQTIDK
jgi:hypothetical protein